MSGLILPFLSLVTATLAAAMTGATARRKHLGDLDEIAMGARSIEGLAMDMTERARVG